MPGHDGATRPIFAQKAAEAILPARGSKARHLGGRHVVSNMITKITWQRSGQVTEPGRYMFRFGWLTVTADDLAIWRQYPEVAFTLVELPDIADDGREQFHLGAFELPLPPMPDEH